MLRKVARSLAYRASGSHPELMTWLLVKVGLRLLGFMAVFWFATRKNPKIKAEPRWAIPLVAAMFGVFNVGTYWLLKPVLNLATFGATSFALPFLMLISRPTKSHPKILAGVAIWVFCMRWVDLYWMIMPNVYHGGAHFGAAEVLSMLGVGGAFVATAGFLMQRGPLVAVGDPRLPESLAFEN